jgi:hypothetical protein
LEEHLEAQRAKLSYQAVGSMGRRLAGCERIVAIGRALAQDMVDDHQELAGVD